MERRAARCSPRDASRDPERASIVTRDARHDTHRRYRSQKPRLRITPHATPHVAARQRDSAIPLAITIRAGCLRRTRKQHPDPADRGVISDPHGTREVVF
jgi:hypothetical protein